MPDVVELPSPFRWDGHHVRADLGAGQVIFTTRRGGHSSGAFSSLNLGPWTEDDPITVDTNRSLVARHVGRPVAGLFQVHGTAVEVVAEPPRPDADPRIDVAQADVLVTGRDDVALGVLTADCLPIAIVADGAVAAIHAGWRGLAGGVVEAAVTAIREAAAPGATLTAAIGPAAGRCCYEVGDEVRAAFAGEEDDVREDRRMDLKLIAERRLRSTGVPTVHDTGLCTLCAPEGLLFSHRRDEGVTGRQMGVVWRS
jgi:YfiH family protein